MSRPSHVFEEHTGEVEIRLEAPTLDGLFVEAGRTLMEVMAGSLDSHAADAHRTTTETVTLHSVDRDALLVDWLNELIFRVETEKRLFGKFEFQSLSERELQATIRGAPAPGLRTLVKAASFHGLKIAGRDGGYTATVVLDV